jgi:phospho-N-acetylmuramoyl-pentapeptide-transferase
MFLPRFWGELNADRGRTHAVEAHMSVGKPLSGGVIFVTIFIVMSLLFVPFGSGALRVLPFILAAMILGYYDDKVGGLHEYTLAIADLAISLSVALVIFGVKPSIVWLPFVSRAFVVPGWTNVIIVAGLIWLAINATNCSDGVDGLSGSLAALSLSILGTLLYVVIGNVIVAKYLLIPYDPEGASWSILAFIMVGCLVGYLWYNAPPSLVLMGDAGSRPLGLLIGIMVAATRNPLLILFVGFVILMNGATGLVKVAMMRFLKVGVLRRIRFPLHDHCRANLGWSSSQVLVRFVLAHIFISAILLALLLKVR